MKSAGRRLLRLVDARARELAIALDGQNEMALASRHSGQGGSVHDVNRSFLWLFNDWPEPFDGLDEPVVDFAHNRVSPHKVTVNGEPLHTSSQPVRARVLIPIGPFNHRTGRS